MKSLINLCAGLTLVLALFSSTAIAYEVDDPFVTPLIAGQHIDVGNVYVWNDDSNLYIKYETANSWYLTETHAHVATTLGGIPQANGNPIPGRFDHKQEHEQETSYEYTIALDVEAGALLYIATHAVVCKEGEVGSTSAQSVLAAPILWAGQHINSGNIVVSIEGEDLVVTYETTDGWGLAETHLYIGTTRPLRSSPGRFPYKREGLGGTTTDEYVVPLSTFSVEPGDTLYLAAHAVVQRPASGGGTSETETGWAEGERIKKRGNWAMFFSVTIPEVSAPREPSTCETAWGAGYSFPGNNWATYFTYTY